MKHRLATVLAVAAIAVAAFEAPAVADEALAGNVAVTPIIGFAAGTLCVGGSDSFDCQSAPIYTRLAVARHLAKVNLGKHVITVAKARAVQANADAVRKLIDPAVAACKVDGKTGECTQRTVYAHRLLRKAQAALAKLN